CLHPLAPYLSLHSFPTRRSSDLEFSPPQADSPTPANLLSAYLLTTVPPRRNSLMSAKPTRKSQIRKKSLRRFAARKGYSSPAAIRPASSPHFVLPKAIPSAIRRSLTS